MTALYSARLVVYSSAMRNLRVQCPLSRMQYLPSKMLYRLSRVQFLLRERMRLLRAMIRMIIRLNLIPRIFQKTRFLPCFVTLWILSASFIVALLATHSSKYTMFHVRQALKITVVSILSVFVLIIPFLGWIAFPILQGILWVIKIISFFQICSGKAKEPAIIRSFGFLR